MRDWMALVSGLLCIGSPNLTHENPLLSSLLLAAAALPAFWASTCQAQTQLLLNGTFLTNTAINGNSVGVGRSGDTGAAYTLNNTTGTTGWFTTGVDASGNNRFEIWASGYNGSPAVSGNSLELANNGGGSKTYQNVTAASGVGMLTAFSFGYATRDSGTDAFTASVLDLTTGATVFSRAFNPTGSFSTNQPFSTTLNVTPGDTYQIAFLDQNTTPGNPGVLGVGGYPANSLSAHIDQVSFVQGVPEPSTWAMLGLGATGAVVVILRRRRVA